MSIEVTPACKHENADESLQYLCNNLIGHFFKLGIAAAAQDRSKTKFIKRVRHEGVDLKCFNITPRPRVTPPNRLIRVYLPLSSLDQGFIRPEILWFDDFQGIGSKSPTVASFELTKSSFGPDGTTEQDLGESLMDESTADIIDDTSELQPNKPYTLNSDKLNPQAESVKAWQRILAAGRFNIQQF